jgi:3-hydroxybutyryl-CoA dehydrogenase
MRLVAKGKLRPKRRRQTLARIEPMASALEGRRVRAGLVVEAIVEDLGAKRALFAQLEALVGDEAVCWRPTLRRSRSRPSPTACSSRAAGRHALLQPGAADEAGRGGVSGLHTDAAVAQAIFDLSQPGARCPCMRRSTPGFIVNRIARPYYAETLALLLEQAAAPHVLDACLKAAGFRMGPCELMDLIGHDTNLAVTQSVYEANFFDKRFVPSLVQREMVDGGLLGRKSGRGFYCYGDGAAAATPESIESMPLPTAKLLRLHGQGPLAEGFATALEKTGQAFLRVQASDWLGLEVDGAQLRLTDGRTASQLGLEVAVFDLPRSVGQGAALAWAPSLRASPAWTGTAARWLAALDFKPQRVADTPGLVVARTLAMLINEAADAVLQGVCTPEGADAAMKLGVNYPAGPFEWLAQWNAPAVIGLLDVLDAHYRGERYRVSPWLRKFV